MLARSTVLLFALACVLAVANAAPIADEKRASALAASKLDELDRRSILDSDEDDGSDNGLQFLSGAGNVAIAFFGDANYDATQDYNALLLGVKVALAGKTTIRTFAAPADAAAVAAGVATTKNAVALAKFGQYSTVQVFVVAHTSAGAAVEAYLSGGSTDASLAGAVFLGYLPKATSFGVPSQILAGELDGVATSDLVAYRFTDRAAGSNVHIAVLEGVTNAHFASGVRKYSTDIAPGNLVAVAVARVRITLALSAWVNTITAKRTVSFTVLLAQAHLNELTAQTAAYSAPWAAARDQDMHQVCQEFEETWINILPGVQNYHFQNYYAASAADFTASKSYIWSANSTIYVPTWIWDAAPSLDAVACKGKSRSQVANLLYPGVDTATLFGAQLDGTSVHQKQYNRAYALASAEVKSRFTASGKSVAFVADDRSPTNGPTYLSNAGPFLFRSATGSPVFNARATIFLSPDTCPVGTPPMFCTVDFLSAAYLKSVGVRTFLKFITITSLQD